MIKDIIDNETFCLYETGNDFDFIAVIQNKTSNPLKIQIFNGFGDDDEFLEIPAESYIGILADEHGYHTLELLKTGNYKICECE